jgi:hypothetical protein
MVDRRRLLQQPSPNTLEDRWSRVARLDAAPLTAAEFDAFRLAVTGVDAVDGRTVAYVPGRPNSSLAWQIACVATS